MRDEVAHEGHLRLIKLTLLDFSIQPVFPQDLEDASDVLDVLKGVLPEDDNIIENADRRQIQVLSRISVMKF